MVIAMQIMVFFSRAFYFVGFVLNSLEYIIVFVKNICKVIHLKIYDKENLHFSFFFDDKFLL